MLTVLKDLPVTTCGILVVQHLSHGFSGKFADFFESPVPDAGKRGTVRRGSLRRYGLYCPGRVPVDAGKAGGRLYNPLYSGERSGGFCPSISVTMHSVAETVKENAMGVILTGMERRWPTGCWPCQAGACTIAQDKRRVIFTPCRNRLTETAERKDRWNLDE